MAEKHGITEQLKAADQIAWVGKMNAIRNAAMEIVNKELIFVWNTIYIWVKDEYRLLFHTLVEFKNKLHREGRDNVAVDEMLIKISKAKKKKFV